MKHLYFLGLLISLPFFGFSQGEFNNWCFGWYKAITFNSGVPVLLPQTNDFTSGVTITVSDSTGKLLFYSDGMAAYNKKNDVMPHGSGLHGTTASFAQSVAVVKNIVDDSTYLLFTSLQYPVPGYDFPVSYSVVDMRMAGGLGDIDPAHKNIPLHNAQKGYGTVTAIRHANNRDAWVVTRLMDPDSNYFAAYRITVKGVDTVPVLSNSKVHTLPSGNPLFPNAQEIKITQDGKKLVCAYNTDTLEYCDFNPQTGQIFSRFTLSPKYNGVHVGNYNSVEFSTDARILYLGAKLPVNVYHVFQFDATKTDSLSFTQSIFDAGKVGPGHQTALQMGPDWKLYGTHNTIDSLWVINNPNVLGSGCGFNNKAFCLLNPCDADGLPQFVQRYKAYIHPTGHCQNQEISFQSDIWPPADSIHWNFDDVGSGTSNFSNLPNPSHFYANPGTYSVELFVRHLDNRTDTTWKTITIFPNPQPSLGADQTICNGDSVTFDAGACAGCIYIWKDLGSGLPVGTNQTFRTGLAGIYSVMVTNAPGCIGIDTVQLITTPVPSVTNNPLNKSICSGESTNIGLTSSVPGTNFHWTASLTSGNITGFSADSGLVINQALTNSLATPGIVNYHITPKIGTCIGTTVTYQVTVNPGDSVKVAITASANNICAGTSVTFTAHPTNPGLTPVYQWKVNGINSGTNSDTFIYTPLTNDVVTCVLSSSLTVCISNNPAISNGITMVVNPNLPVWITITALPNPPVCSGTTFTFTAHPSNEGNTPTYQWKVNGINAGTNLSTYSYTPLNGDLVSCILTSSETCTTNNPATSTQYPVTVNPILPVTVSITATSNPFCAGSSVTFTATPTFGGTTPDYQWKVNGINAGINSNTFTYNPVNNDQVLCILTSSEQCTSNNPASSTTITMLENTNLLAGVSISATSNPFCPGTSVNFTATPSNGGTPIYQWKVNGINVGINSNTYTYNPVNSDSVRCIMTSNLVCVTGNPASSNKIIMNGNLAPIVTFPSCFDTITTINAKPIKLKGGIPLGGTYSGPGVNSLTGIYTPSLAGLGTHTITYSYTNVALCTALAHTHIINFPLSIVNCGSPITDIRDSKIYQTVQIGSQCWLATNLNFGTTIASTQDQRDNCIAEKYCYNDNPLNCGNQGGLYQWDEVMQFDETPADQGFCPPGWHIPTENDWNIFFATFINNGFAGSPLKYSGYSGFNALLSGARHINKGWDFQGFATFFWSSTALSITKVWAHGLNDPDPSVSVYPSSRANAFSVRCLKD